MAQNDKIQLFEDKRIRTAWDEEKEEWYFSIVDVVAVLTDQPDYQAARNYWKVTKKRLKDEGNETVTSCNQLKMTAADGKRRLTDVADTEQLLRIIQSIPRLSRSSSGWRKLAGIGSRRPSTRNGPSSVRWRPTSRRAIRVSGSISACRQFRCARN